jgi:hypothetical protein
MGGKRGAGKNVDFQVFLVADEPRWADMASHPSLTRSKSNVAVQ